MSEEENNNEEENNLIEKREEIIFLYDATNTNPNGDPDQENRPRLDNLTGNILVTDLRIKRTIRDYVESEFDEDKNQIVVKRQHTASGKTMQMDELIFEIIYGDNWESKLKEYEKNGKDDIETLKSIRESILANCFDVRAFGCVTTLDGFPWTFTGAVQFSLGMSLNQPNLREVPIAPIVATKEDVTSGGLGNYKGVDYALISVPGIVCPNIAKGNTFTKEDLNLIYESLWNGTKALHSRSKVGQIPRLLLSVVSKDGKFQIGGLASKLELIEDEDLTGIKDVKLEINPLLDRLETFEENIEKIKYKIDPDIKFVKNGEETELLKELEKKFDVEEFEF